MKKIMVLIACACLAACLEGPQGPAGKDGQNGNDAKVYVIGDSLVCTADSKGVIQCLKIFKGTKGDKGDIGLTGAKGDKGEGSISVQIHAMVDSVKKKELAIVDIVMSVETTVVTIISPAIAAVPATKDSKGNVIRAAIPAAPAVTSSNNYYVPLGHGSGTIALVSGKKYVVSAAHVLGNFRKFEYYSRGRLVGSSINKGAAGKIQTATDQILSIPNNIGRDMMMITAQFTDSIEPIKMKTSYSPQIGDLTILASYPGIFEKDLQYSIGFITDDNANATTSPLNNTWTNSFITDAAATAGSSGGPVFDQDGNWIGLHVGGFDNMGGPELNVQLRFL